MQTGIFGWMENGPVYLSAHEQTNSQSTSNLLVRHARIEEIRENDPQSAVMTCAGCWTTQESDNSKCSKRTSYSMDWMM